MTSEEFGKVIPRKTIIKANLKDSCKELLVKFFVCNENGEYWMCCTSDFSNPSPTEILVNDYYICFNEADIVRYE